MTKCTAIKVLGFEEKLSVVQSETRKETKRKKNLSSGEDCDERANTLNKHMHEHQISNNQQYDQRRFGWWGELRVISRVKSDCVRL